MEYFYAPFGWILSWCYEIVGNYGWSLVLFTVLTRFILLPLSISQQKGMAKQTRLQPKIKKIQQRYAGNQQKINEEMNALYQREGASPLGAGCLPLAIQLPIMMGLYGVIYRPLSYVLHLSKDTVEVLTTAVQNITGEATGRAASAIELSVINHAQEVVAGLPTLGADIADKLLNFDFTFLGINMAATPDFKVFDTLWLIPVLSGVTSLMTSALSYFRQRKTNPEIGLATIYRTVQVLVDLHLIDKISFDDDVARYELRSSNAKHHHHHAICLGCGEVFSFEDDLLENLEAAVEERLGFAVVDHEVKLYGYCRDCREKMEND